MDGFTDDQDDGFNEDFAGEDETQNQTQNVAFDEEEPADDSGEEGHNSEDQQNDGDGEGEERDENEETGLLFFLSAVILRLFLF